MEIKISDGKVLVRFPYDPDMVSVVNREGLGMRWNRGRRFWYHDLTPGFARAFIKVFQIDNIPKQIIEKAKIPEVLNNWEPSEYLMEHQRDGAVFALSHPRYGFFWDTGVGKTLLGLELIKQKQVKTLVVCPLSIIENAWIEDAEKFCPEINIINLWELKRKSASIQGKRIYNDAIKKCQAAVINFERFRTMTAELENYGFRMLIVDESSKAKNPKSKVTKALLKFADLLDFVYLFSGTPAPNSELEYYPQIRMLDRSIFPGSFYSFRNRYFVQTGFCGFTWELPPEEKQGFLEKIARVSNVINKHDVLDLPEKTNNIRSVILTTAELKFYREMERHMCLDLKDVDVFAANAAAKCMKLREGTSGFFLTDDGKVIKTGTSKLTELKELLEEIGQHQVVIWTHFHYEEDKICELLDLMKKTYSRADGTVSQNSKNAAISEFKKKDVQYFVAHPASVGHGITITNCSYMVYFSMSYSWELHKQSMDRIYRKGQRNACSYYYLVAKGTIDEAIMQAVSNKKKVMVEAFNYIKNLI